MQSFNVVFKKVFRKAIHDGSLRLYIINIINTVRQNKTQLVTYATPESFPRQILILHPMMPRLCIILVRHLEDLKMLVMCFSCYYLKRKGKVDRQTERKKLQ